MLSAFEKKAKNTEMNKPEKVPDTWQTQKFRQKCECEFCQKGLAKTHNDKSQVQTLHLVWKLNKKNDPFLGEITIVGGTTKCARILSQYIEENDRFSRENLENRNIIEVGSGTGLVGLVCSMLGSHVIMTDQSVVMELLETNVEANLKNLSNPALKSSEPDVYKSWSLTAQKKNKKDKITTNEIFGKIELLELYWGAKNLPKKLENFSKDLIIGCDLIFAKENIPLLINIFKLMCPPEKNTEIIFAHINRFSYEKDFFRGMIKSGFSCDKFYDEDEIMFFSFKRLTLGE